MKHQWEQLKWGPTKVLQSPCVQGWGHGYRGTSDQNAQAGPVQRKLFFHWFFFNDWRVISFSFCIQKAWRESRSFPVFFLSHLYFHDVAVASLMRHGLPPVPLVGGTQSGDLHKGFHFLVTHQITLHRLATDQRRKSRRLGLELGCVDRDSSWANVPALIVYRRAFPLDVWLT